MGFNSLTTTTHPSNVNVPSSGQQVTARLFARKVSIAAPGGTGPKIPWSGTLQVISPSQRPLPDKTLFSSVIPVVCFRTKYINTCRKGSQKHNYNCNIQGVSVYTNVSVNYVFRPLLVRPSSGWIP